jgi:hypothetical protein
MNNNTAVFALRVSPGSIILVTEKRFDFLNEVLALNRAEQQIKK